MNYAITSLTKQEEYSYVGLFSNEENTDRFLQFPFLNFRNNKSAKVGTYKKRVMLYYI